MKKYIISLGLLFFISTTFAEESNPVFQTQTNQFMATNIHSAGPFITDQQCQHVFPTQWTNGKLVRYKKFAIIDVTLPGLTLVGLDSEGSKIEQAPVSNSSNSSENHSFVDVVRHGTMAFSLNGKPVKTPVILTARFRMNDASEKSWVLKSAYCTADIKTKLLSMGK